MNGNADKVFSDMLYEVRAFGFERQSSSPVQSAGTLEAMPGCQFILTDIEHCVVTKQTLDLRFAVANVLHFFAATEDAGILRKYYRHADRFLTGDKLIGAYGAVAVPQIDRCIQLLLEDPWTRRAVVQLHGCMECDVNRPSCWNLLHFLLSKGGLTMLVYQRSLNLLKVMPYDCILLCNILNYVGINTRLPVRSIRWTVGSLHTVGESRAGSKRCMRMLLPVMEPKRCMEALENPSSWEAQPYSQYLRSAEEVYT